MVRILHIVTYMGRGGLETMIMNYYRKIDRTKVQFDFLVHRDFEADYDSEIKKLGGNLYRLPKLNPFSSQYLNALDNFFREHNEYKIVHSHLDCMSCIPLKYAEKNGIPIRIAHAHSSNQTKDKNYVLKLLFKRKIKRYATDLFACSEAAGKWMFGTDNFKVINNAIDTQKYVYSVQTSHRVRDSFGIGKSAFVVGHVGRFDPPKNHDFIIDVFNSLLSKKDNARLLLVGEGNLRSKIEEKVKSFGIEDKVVFTGLRSDVPDILQAMDVFLFPSIYEGLPVSIVEAQASGLPCLISDKVPVDCKITDHIYIVNLSDGDLAWADKVLSFSEFKRPDTTESIKKAGFDICSNAEFLEDFYLNSYNK